MSITEEILKELKNLSKTQKTNTQGKYTTATATFKASSYDEVLDIVNKTVEPVAENGEKIICSIDRGEIIDSKIKGFDIEKGTLIELYDYKHTTVAFIRLYKIKDKDKTWATLYVDENPDTPWWTKEERGD